MNNNKVKGEVRVGFRDVTTFLARAELVFNVAILGTPTGDVRDALTELNIERLSLIENSKSIAAYAKRLRALLDLLVINEDARDKMSCDDTRFGDTTNNRCELIKQLVAIMKE